MKLYQKDGGASASSGSILDEITAEVSQLSDEELAAAAAQIQAANDRAKQRMKNPDTQAKMRQREKRRRETNKLILKMAKDKGLVPPAPTA